MTHLKFLNIPEGRELWIQYKRPEQGDVLRLLREASASNLPFTRIQVSDLKKDDGAWILTFEQYCEVSNDLNVVEICKKYPPWLILPTNPFKDPWCFTSLNFSECDFADDLMVRLAIYIAHSQLEEISFHNCSISYWCRQLVLEGLRHLSTLRVIRSGNSFFNSSFDLAEAIAAQKSLECYENENIAGHELHSLRIQHSCSLTSLTGQVYSNSQAEAAAKLFYPPDGLYILDPGVELKLLHLHTSLKTLDLTFEYFMFTAFMTGIVTHPCLETLKLTIIYPDWEQKSIGQLFSGLLIAEKFLMIKTLDCAHSVSINRATTSFVMTATCSGLRLFSYVHSVHATPSQKCGLCGSSTVR